MIYRIFNCKCDDILVDVTQEQAIRMARSAGYRYVEEADIWTLDDKTVDTYIKLMEEVGKLKR